MSLDLLKARLRAAGGNTEGRLAKEKLDTLKKACESSYQGETVIRGEEKARCLINSNKLKMDYDDKILSIPLKYIDKKDGKEKGMNVKVGDIVLWERTNQYWIIYLEQLSEDAYFRGFIRKAQHKVRWLNDFGKEKEVYGAVRGPVETKVKEEQKSKISFDIPNYSLSVLVPNNEYTKDLKRYKKVNIDNEIWEITVADRISEPGVIDLQLIESKRNKDEDSTLVGDLNKPKIEVVSNLDKLENLPINKPFVIEYSVLVNGRFNKDLTDSAMLSAEGTGVSLANNTLVINSKNTAAISIRLDNAQKTFKYRVRGIANGRDEVSWSILGESNVKSYGRTSFTIQKLVDGTKSNPNGNWVIADNKKLFVVDKIENDTITLKWNSGIMGNVTIKYFYEDKEVATKDVVVESLI